MAHLFQVHLKSSVRFMVVLGLILSVSILSFDCRAKMTVEMVPYPTGDKLRAGILLEKESLKGCVMYLQGLGDSIMNHDPLFNALAEAGYRILSFDYMGQGGSEGRMDNTRISNLPPSHATKQMKRRYERFEKFYEISTQAEFIWDRYKTIQNRYGQTCAVSKKLLIGWSTGGLAAYSMAKQQRADAVVLIAPGIHPRMLVGEAKFNVAKLLPFQNVITERTLTRNTFPGQLNPHVDPVKPRSPVDVPTFAANLLLVASREAQDYKIPQQIPGVVFLSGNEDSYVDRNKTLVTLEKNASHFSTQTYEGALHELDNELPEVASDLYSKTIQFFNSL